jgi:hypothetical protein
MAAVWFAGGAFLAWDDKDDGDDFCIEIQNQW